MAEHPRSVPRHGFGERLLAGLAGCPDCREDPAAGRVELLVARPARAQRELVDAVAREARMGVAVDEPGDGGEASAG